MTTIEGPTPRGGDHAEVRTHGDALEIEEFDVDGTSLGRTYVDPQVTVDDSPQVSAGESEALLADNQDVVKAGTWDIWHVVDGQWLHPVETLEELLRALGLADTDIRYQRQEVGKMMGHPVWEPAPQALRDEVNAWMVATRQE